jgi:bacterioferritin-associated ferredoxin
MTSLLHLSPSMIVCVCNRVSDREIRQQAAEGCASFDELQMATGVATCCGCCESCAREVFEVAQIQADCQPEPAHRHISITVVAMPA